MMTIKYPDSSPINSMYLTLDKGRRFLEVSDCVYNDVGNFAKNSLKNTNDGDRIEWDNVLEICHSLIKENNEMLFEQKIFTDRKCLEYLHETLVSRIKPLTHKSQFAQTLNSKAFFQKIYQIAVHECVLFQYNAVGITSLSKFDFTQDDFRVFGSDYAVYKAKKREPYCHDFALYHLHVEQAFRFISNLSEDAWPENFWYKINDILGNWNFKLVQSPKNGDLVIYYATINRVTRATHLGIFNKDQKVYSKMGEYPVSEHEINVVPYNYGHYVQFFRKAHKFAIQEDFLKELEAARKGRKSFSHTACASVITAEGTKAYFINFFESMFRNKVSSMLEGSFYGRKAFIQYKAMLIASLNQIPKDCSFNLLAMINRIEKLVKKVEEAVVIETHINIDLHNALLNSSVEAERK